MGVNPLGPALLFCPADRPDRLDNALNKADLVIIDLEDAVAEDAKARARKSMIDHLLDPSRVVVRVNGAATEHHAADLEEVRRTGYHTVMLPKCETPEQVAALAEWQVIPLCETPAGILNSPTIAREGNVIGLMWGVEDLTTAVGGRTSRRPSGTLRDVNRFARCQVLLAAAAAGRQAIDSVYVDIADLEGLRNDAEDAAQSGFSAKACIHPNQVDVVRAAFRPGDDELAWAQRVVAALGPYGVAAVDGKMVDAPIIGQARAVLRAAGQDG